MRYCIQCVGEAERTKNRSIIVQKRAHCLEMLGLRVWGEQQAGEGVAL